MVAVVGFAMIICIVALLLKGKMSPIVVLTVIPAVAALILGHGPVEQWYFIYLLGYLFRRYVRYRNV